MYHAYPIVSERLASTTTSTLQVLSQCSNSIWPIISELNGSISFFGSFISLFPQIFETYRDKTVDGLSPLFLIAWVCGDITSLTGALLTKQLLFQIILAFYFLLNDIFACGQYYYYGVLYKNTLATIGHEAKPVLSSVAPSHPDNVTAEDIEELIETANSDPNNDNTNTATCFRDIERTTSRGTRDSNRSRRDLLIAAVAIANNISGANAMWIQNHNNKHDGEILPPGFPSNHKHTEVGIFLSWLGAFFYVGARIPQLIKNYKRKSTDGISPFLFATTLICNITYNISIFTSCRFIDSDDKLGFFNNALPFIIGSAGTVIFDLIYFYQYYVLYSSDTRIREIERLIYEENEDEIIAQQHEETNNIPTEQTPLIQHSPA